MSRTLFTTLCALALCCQPAASQSNGFFDGFRTLPFPTLYGPNKTAVTVDLVEAGIICAFIIIALSFLVILPGLQAGERIKWFIFAMLSLCLGFFMLLSNFGMAWEKGTIEHVRTQYKAGTDREIDASMGLYIGLRGVNITLEGTTEDGSRTKHVQNGETIDYNERMTWDYTWQQGRTGFGPFAFEFNQQYRANQLKGLPYPILWVAEYFTLDGENIRWGRFYKQAGYYAHIMCWLAFPLWLLANIMFVMVVSYGGALLVASGTSLVIANILYVSIRNPIALKIPVGDETLSMEYGWSFWLNLVTGLLCIISGLLVLVVNWCYSDQISSFFGVQYDKVSYNFMGQCFTSPTTPTEPVETISETTMMAADEEAPAAKMPNGTRPSTSVKDVHVEATDNENNDDEDDDDNDDYYNWVRPSEAAEPPPPPIPKRDNFIKRMTKRVKPPNRRMDNDSIVLENTHRGEERNLVQPTNNNNPSSSARPRLPPKSQTRDNDRPPTVPPKN